MQENITLSSCISFYRPHCLIDDLMLGHVWKNLTIRLHVFFRQHIVENLCARMHICYLSGLSPMGQEVYLDLSNTRSL